MPTQKLIDQYFKSTSGNKGTNCGGKLAKGSNRSRPSLSLNLKNRTVNGVKTPAGTSAVKKKTWRRSSFGMQHAASRREFRTPDKLVQASIPALPQNSQSREDKSDAKIESSDVEIINIGEVTPPKKTIKSFAKACNSPSSNSSPGRMSLKRRKNSLPEVQSPPKRKLTYDDVIPGDSQPEVIEIPDGSQSFQTGQSPIDRDDFIALPSASKNVENRNDKIETNSQSNPTTKSSILECDFPDDFDPDIVELSMENSQKMSAMDLPKKLIVDSPNNVNGSGAPGTIEKNVTAKNGKNGDLSKSGNSPSTSRWKLVVTIRSPDRLMTALSSDWQSTLDVTNKQHEPSTDSKDKIENNNIGSSIIKSERNDENLAYQDAIRASINSAMKSTPRRALFSPPKTAANVSSEVKNCGSSLPPTPGHRAVDTPTKTNGPSNSLTQNNGTSNSSRQLCRSSNSSIKISGSSNSPIKINGSSNSPTKNNGSSNSSRKISGSSNSPTKNNGSSNSSRKIRGSSNSPIKISGSSNSPIKISGSSNSPIKISGSSNSPIKISGSSNSPIKIDGSSNCPTKTNRSSNLPANTNGPSYTPKKPEGSPNSPPKQTPSSSRKASFSPRVKNSPQKMRKERVDTDLATRAVENLNQAKQGVIPLNDFDLEAVYAKKSFELEYGSLNTRTAIKYEAKDVQVPEDKHADHFFMVLVNVFSEPMNCGYFDDDELDKVFSILTLSPEAQALLVRMLKRKRGWHRVSAIQYPEIAPDLKAYFRELVQHGFLDDNFKTEEISILLDLLQVDEVKTVCKASNISHIGRKSTLIDELLKLSTKALFPGMKTPSSALREKVTSMLETCIRFPEAVEDLLNRIFILLIPNQDPEETMVEAFNMLVLVHIGQKIFPPTPKKRFPIFRNRLHLIRYAKARSAWNDIINASKNKDWNKVRAVGQSAYDRLQPYFESNENEDENEISTLPTHVKRFDANYAWTKVLSKSVDAYKKTKEGIDTAANFLEALLSRRNKIPGNRIRWYDELALIEMHHRKDLETSANITIEALTRDSLTEIDAAVMLDRAKKLLKRKQGISARTKERIIEAIEHRPDMFISPSEPVVNEIEARMVQGNVTGSKSLWSVDLGNDVGYMSVEEVALHHYSQKGFKGGLHCEGALPITLFATLFWSEIYEVSVPGAFVSLYQDAPLDLYSSCFFDNRRERIEGKLNMFRALDSESLGQLIHEDFMKYRHYQSLIQGGLFPNADDFKDLVACLGNNGVIQICERLIGNYNQWKSGFPDLVVWNSATKTCKIVEVKGPGDSLSTKQKLWIHFLESLGIPVEVCVVKSTTVKFHT